jgi:hypothetical protein
MKDFQKRITLATEMISKIQLLLEDAKWSHGTMENLSTKVIW